MLDEPKVHIVDDDKAIRDSLSLLFRAENIPFVSYESAEDFLSHKGFEQLGCLLLDIRMPGMNGLELLDLLKQQDLSIPVIFITGHGDVMMAVNAMKSGAVDFIEKPFKSEHLLNTIRKCLNNCITINNDHLNKL